MRLLLIVNPAASSVTTRARAAVEAELAAVHDVLVVETTRRGDAVDLARAAAVEGVDAVAVLGGDGTLNEAANGLAGTSCPLAPLPGGSTNVFARALGYPNDAPAAARSVAAALARRSVRRIGLGRAGERHFLFNTGVGFDAAVVRQVERRPALKRLVGQPVFVAATLSTWARHYDRRKPSFSVRFGQGDADAVEDGYFTIVLNLNPYTYFGSNPIAIAPDATLDSRLVVVTVRSLSPSMSLLLARVAFGASDRLRASPLVDYRADVERVEVLADRPVPYQLDGDYLGDATRLELCHVPDALDVVMP